MKLFLVLTILLFTIPIVGQGYDHFSLRVVDDHYESTEGLSVIVQSNSGSKSLKTDKNGMVKFETLSFPAMIVVFDENVFPKYGVVCTTLMSMESNSTIQIPLYPKNKKEAIIQVNQFLTNLTSHYGYYSPSEFARTLLKKRKNLPLLESPGLFKITPVSKNQANGKYNWKISGRLFERFLESHLDSTGIINGFQFNYQFSSL